MPDTSALAEFGKKFCDVPGYTDCWVQFKTSGYPRKLRREWDAANVEQVLEIIARYISAQNLRDIDGQLVSAGASLDNVEDGVVAWTIRAFANFWLVELLSPRPNS